MGRRAGSDIGSSATALWVAVGLLSTITLGNYYLFDLPGALGIGEANTWQAWFKEHHAAYGPEQNGALYSSYSWPNIILGAIGGLLVDQVLGLRSASIAFTLCVLFGSCITYFGVVGASFPLLLLGRLVFGIGGETQIVAQYSFVGSWFQGRTGSGLAFGIIASVQRLGAGATFALGPYLAEHYGVLTATAGSAVISAGCVGTLLAVLVLHRGLDTRPPLAEDAARSLTLRGVTKEIRRAATPPLMLLAAANALFSMALYGYCAIAVPYLVARDRLIESAAGRSLAVFFAVVIVAAPIAGYVIERAGRHMWFLAAACASAAVATAMFAAGEGTMTGSTYSVALAIPQAIVLSAVYPYVSSLVPLECEGFAFGILVSAQNAGMAAATLTNGLVLAALPRIGRGGGDASHYANYMESYQWLSRGEVWCYALAGAAFLSVEWLRSRSPPASAMSQEQHDAETAQLATSAVPAVAYGTA